MHAHLYFHINPTLVVDPSKEIVSLDDFIRDEVKAEAHVFVIGHGSHEVEIGEVHVVEFGVGSGNGGVDEEFDGDEIGGWRAFVAIVGNAVAAHSEACADNICTRCIRKLHACVGGADGNG